MGLTISWNSPTLRQGTPGKGIESSDWRALGEGLGGLQRWSQKQKAADLMEGKANAVDRIRAIDAEIAELEAQLQGFEDKRAADTLAAQRRAEAQEEMAGYTQEPVDQYAAQYAAKQNWEYSNNPVAAKYGTVSNPHLTNDNVNAGFVNDLTELERQNAMRAAAMGKYRWGR